MRRNVGYCNLPRHVNTFETLSGITASRKGYK
jgi:hypothetical protein